MSAVPWFSGHVSAACQWVLGDGVLDLILDRFHGKTKTER
jgi:hypothetical protein